MANEIQGISDLGDGALTHCANVQTVAPATGGDTSGNAQALH
jgi:hypothetical protein